MATTRSMSACAPAHTLKPGWWALRFIGSAERRLAKPECISPQIARQWARAARSAGSRPASGFASARYSAMASVSQTLAPSCVRQGTRNDGDSSSSSARASRIVERDQLLLELQAAELAQQPAAQAPGRVVLAGDGEGGLGHLGGSRSCFWCESCIDGLSHRHGQAPTAVQLSFQRRTTACSISPTRPTPTSWCRCDPGPWPGSTPWRPGPASEALKHLRNLTAAYELIARAGLTHVRPPYGINQRAGGQPRGGRDRGGRGVDAVRHACCISRRTSRSPSRACWWWRRCPGILPLCCAAWFAPCCRSTMSA